MGLVAEGRAHHAPRRMVPILVGIFAVIQRQMLDQRLAINADALLARYPASFAAVNVKGRSLVQAGKLDEADALTQPLRLNPDGKPMEALYHDTLAQIDVAKGRLEDAIANYSAALNLDPGLSKAYARSLSQLGFLPLSNAPEGVLTALRRCIDVKKETCRVSS